jgi:hypothetical protein
MNRVGLEKEIVSWRKVVRLAAKSYNDEKCFLDFFRLFDLLPEGRSIVDRRILTPEVMKSNCHTFINCMGCYLQNPDKSIDEIYDIWKNMKPY